MQKLRTVNWTLRKVVVSYALGRSGLGGAPAGGALREKNISPLVGVGREMRHVTLLSCVAIVARVLIFGDLGDEGVKASTN